MNNTKIVKKIKEKDINNKLSDFPENLVKLINGSLDTKDFRKKLIARRNPGKNGKNNHPANP